MPRFRKKPVEVEAVQWTGDNEAELVTFAGDRFHVVDPEDRGDDPDQTAAVFDTLHNTWVRVYDGQWIVKGVKGEFYPIAPEVLAETYVSVDALEEDLRRFAAETFGNLRGLIEQGRGRENPGGEIDRLRAIVSRVVEIPREPETLPGDEMGKPYLRGWQDARALVDKALLPEEESGE